MRPHSDTDKSIITVNGEFLSHISISNRGYLFGDGVFETLLYTQGKIPLLALHMERLRVSCLRLSITFDEVIIRKQVDTVQSKITQRNWTSAKIRLTITRTEGGKASYPAENVSFNSSVQADILNGEVGGDAAVSLKPAKCVLPSFPALSGIKHTNRLPYIIGAAGIELRADQEVFFCNADGNIIETMHHNIFFLDDSSDTKRIVTPKIDVCGVAGILRQLVKDTLCVKLDMAFEESFIPLNTISHYRACFIGNAVRGFTAVKSVDGVRFSESTLTTTLNQCLRQLYQ